MNNIFVSWKQKIESRIISDLKSQYTESEEQIRQRKEQFLKKQKKIILIEIIAGAVFLAFLIITDQDPVSINMGRRKRES